MAFLDNSGDIILDAVLTDAGRQRLSKGDGSFRITQFALADDEINYGLYNLNHPSGSAYYDLEILQTPVFEAFTNNIASLNNKLISINRTNLLYLPVLKINNLEFPYAPSALVQTGYIFTADENTEKLINDYGNGKLEYLSTPININSSGVIYGFTPASAGGVRIDQGIDNKNKPYSSKLDSDLTEEQYSIEIDNRIAKLLNREGVLIKESFVDDDDMAMYYAAMSDGTNTVTSNDNIISDSKEVIIGQRGSILRFKLQAALDVSSSDYLFDQIGVDLTSYFTVSGASLSAANIGYSKIKSILTSVRVTGLTTGNSIDVPILVLKAS